MEIAIGAHRFDSKAAAKNFVRSIVNAYADDERIYDREHDAFLRALIQLHPEASEKIGVGVSYFTIKHDDKTGKTRHFLITRLDHSTADFSWHCCIDGRDWRKETLQTLRDAVADQVIAFRNSVFDAGNVKCAITNKPLSVENADIDHEPPLTFIRLVEEWLASREIQLTDVKLGPSRDLQVIYEFADPELRKSWQDFHHQRAVLRTLSKFANRSLARKRL